MWRKCSCTRLFLEKVVTTWMSLNFFYQIPIFIKTVKNLANFKNTYFWNCPVFLSGFYEQVGKIFNFRSFLFFLC